MVELAVQRWRLKQVMGWLGVMLLPLVLTLVWGTFYADTTYDALRYAQNLGAERPFAYDALVSGYRAPLESPLFVLALALLSKMGLPILESSLVLSGLGWGSTAVLLVLVGYGLKRPFAGWLAAALLVVHPVIFLQAGTATGWVTAVFLLLLWLILQPNRSSTWIMAGRSVGLGLLLWLGTDVSIIVLVLLLWGWLWRRQNRFPWTETALLGGAGLLLAGGLYLWAMPIAWFNAPFSTWLPAVQEWVQTSEFYWLYLPLILLGVISERKNEAALVGLVWGVTAVFSGSHLALSATAVLFALLVGLGVDGLGRWLVATGKVRAGVSYPQLMWGLGGITLLFLGAAHLDSVWTSYQFRPRIQYSIEQAAASWLTANSQPEEIVFASRRVAFLADRPLLPGSQSQIDPLEAGQVIAPLVSHPPDFVVSLRTIGWEFVTQTNWFQGRYRSQQRFGSPLAVNAPFEVWSYEASPFDLGETRPIQVSTNQGIDLVAYRYWPSRIEPGDGVYVTLFWRAREPVIHNFETIVRVVSPVTGEAFAQKNEPTPRSIPANWWEEGSLIEERVILTTTEKIAYGAYQLNVSVRDPDEELFTDLYQNNDTNALDRILLGYTAVPWSEGIAETAVPVQATFGEQMRLEGVVVNGRVAPGETITVDLYWLALQTPPQNYVVFIHLLNAANEQISGDDSQPVDGSFPTAGWQPGDIIKDSHSLLLPQELGEDPFQIKVGVYLPENGERLPVWDANGREQPERSIQLPPQAIP